MGRKAVGSGVSRALLASELSAKMTLEAADKRSGQLGGSMLQCLVSLHVAHRTCWNPVGGCIQFAVGYIRKGKLGLLKVSGNFHLSFSLWTLTTFQKQLH